MPVTRTADAPHWDLPGTHFAALASPSRGGSAETSVWRLVLDAGTRGTEHEVTRSEVFAPVRGTAEVSIGGRVDTVGVGDALVVPPHTPFTLSNTGAEPFEAIVCLPAGGQAAFPGAEPFTPEWVA